MIYYYYSVHFRFAVLSIVGLELGPVLVLFFFHFFCLGCTFRGKISTRSSTVFGKLRLGFVLALRLVLRLELELGLSLVLNLTVALRFNKTNYSYVV